MPPPEKILDLVLGKEDFKFSSAHFSSHGPGARERLHGHNYRVSVAVRGELGSDGTVLDFAAIKSVVRALCRELDEKFLCPMASTSAIPTLKGTQVELACIDGSFFSFPAGDVILLPLSNSTVEELAIYLARRIGHALSGGRVGESGGAVGDVEGVGRGEQGGGGGGGGGEGERREGEVGNGLHSITVGVAETPGQEARYTLELR